MKDTLIFLITKYRKYRRVASPFMNTILGPGGYCRFEETCSQYSERMISEHGVIKGICLSLLRLSKCHPFSKANLKYESI